MNHEIRVYCLCSWQLGICIDANTASKPGKFSVGI